MSAFAVLCADDGSLIFYNRDTVPTAGETFEGKVASNVYTGFENKEYSNYNYIPWYNERASIISVSFTPEFATVKPISTKYWFQGAVNMTSFNDVNFNTSNVTSMSNMFNGCSALTSLDLSNFDTSKVTHMNYMFYGCYSLINIDVSNFDTSNVTDMLYMFGLLEALTILDISSFDTSKVQSMSNMFRRAFKLNKIYVSDMWSTTSVTSHSNMFTECDALVGDIAYNNAVVDKTYAKYNGGYLTYKFFPTHIRNRFVIDAADLNKIANAIRKKTGKLDGLVFPDGFIAAIESLSVAATDDGSGNVVVNMDGSSADDGAGNVVIS